MISAANHAPLTPLSFLTRARRAFPAKVAVGLLPLRWTGGEVHETAKEVFGRLASILHHQRDGVVLRGAEWKRGLGQNPLQFLPCLGQRVCRCCRGAAAG